jgi:hypothetical protein
VRNNKIKEELNFYFVIGFMTAHAKERIMSIIEAVNERGPSNVKIHLICHHFIKSVKEKLTEQGLGNNTDFKNKLAAVLTNNNNDVIDKPLVTTSWKRPDFMSSYDGFFSGYNSSISIYTGELTSNLPAEYVKSRNIVLHPRSVYGKSRAT